MTLLLVNDIVLETETMKSDIPWSNYNLDSVFTAYSADDARKVILQNKIDILICDIEMPGEDGLSLIKWIRENEYDIDCIILTCHADFSYARHAISLDCLDFLLLPVKYEDIAAAVQKVYNRRSRRLNDKRLQEYGKSWLQEYSETGNATQDEPHRTPAVIVENCINYILQNVSDENLSVSDIASHFYLNPIYLNRIFKKEKGISMSQWIIQKRMELASTLLETTEQSATTIANKVGYSNYPYFSTVFKKYFDCTPSQYLRGKK